MPWMHCCPLVRALLALLALLAGPALAQPSAHTHTPPRADCVASAPALAAHSTAAVTEAQAPVPVLTFRSVLDRYRAFNGNATSEQVPSWRAANDTVARIGGWRAYLREAQRPVAEQAQ